MDIDFVAHVERTLDDYRYRIEALEKALTQLPEVEIQEDISRPQGVVVRNPPAPERP